MSQSKTMAIARAMQLAAAVRAELEPGCVKIEVAGSVRRRKANVSDIEFVLIPQRTTNLLGEEGQSF